MADVTLILQAIERGDPRATDELLPIVYDELRKLAAARMLHESPDHTLAATALVHEAYIRLVAAGDRQEWNSRGHFFGAAAEAMRRILVEDARRKGRLRHGGGRARIGLTGVLAREPDDEESDEVEILDLDEALTRLEQVDPAAFEVIRLRYFTGMTIEQAAAALGVSVRTANRHWSFARAWLYRELQERADA